MSASKNNKDSILNFKDYLKLNESTSESERLLCVEVFKDIINKINKNPYYLEYSSFELSIDDDDVNDEASVSGGTDVSMYDIDLNIKLKTSQNNISPGLLKLFKSNDFDINGLSGLADMVGGDTELLQDLGFSDDGEIDIYIGTFDTSGRTFSPWSSRELQPSDIQLEWETGEADYILINITTDGHDSVETKIYNTDPILSSYISDLLNFMDSHAYPEEIQWGFMNKK